MTRRIFAIFMMLAVLCTGVAHAANVQETLTTWQRVSDPDSGAPFEEIKTFLGQHPAWPDQRKIRVRAERALRGSDIPDAELLLWFQANPPISGVGKWTYAELLKRTGQQPEIITSLIKEAWRDADLTEEEENNLRREFNGILTAEDDWARTDRLLWEEKVTPARHLISRLPVAEQVMFQARIALIKDEKTSAFLLKQVSAKLLKEPGLMYERLRYRLRKNDKAGVRELLLKAPKTVPYPERWWKIREGEIRRAIDERNYKLAAQLLENHGQSDGASFATALWLEGWIKLRFQNNAKEAYQAFYHMHDAVKTPVSKSRAAYWAGRAAKQSGDAETANGWFRTAAKHSTTFYGQLAQTELEDAPTLNLPDEPGFELFASDPVLSDGLKEAISISIQNGEHKLATRLINHVLERSEDEHSMLTVAALGHALSVPHISVKAAKKAQQQGVVLKNVGYPRPATDKDLPIERALTLAIIRQESEFDPQAESPSGALGLMQLLPSTAKETAKKIGEQCGREQLFVPDDNCRFGSHYLGRMIDAYDGSYIRAIAAYNAGPGNVRKWLGNVATGDTPVYAAIDWIERIPFSETRNYVQRVIENLQVYRALEGDTKLQIQQDLLR